MMKKLGVVTAVCIGIAVAVAIAQQQDKSKRPSPPGTATYKFDDGKTITVEYSRPSVKGRKVFGGAVVPYGQVWRTGANEATTFNTTADLDVGGVKLPAGNYTLYTLPAEGAWKLIISKKTGQWGIPYPEGEDLARADMKVAKLDEPVEQFTISFASQGPNAAVMTLAWENTEASVAISEANK